MLGLICFSLLFGYFTTRLAPERRETMLSFFHGLNDVMLMITELVMRFAPLGVFGLVAKVAATTGPEAIRQVALFFFTVLLGLIVHTFAVLPLLMYALARINPIRHFLVVVRGIFLKGAGFDVLWPQIATLAAMGATILSLAASRFRKTTA